MKGKMTLLICALIFSFLTSCGGSKKEVKETAAISELTYGLPLSDLTTYEKYDIGKDLIAKGEYEGAAIVFQNVVLKERELVPAYFYLGKVYQKVNYQGQRKKAENEDSEAAEDDEEDFARLERSSKKDIFPPELDGSNLAIHMLKRAIALRPDFLPAYSELMRIYLENGDKESTLALYETATTLDTLYLTTDYRLGFMALRKDKVEEAIANFRDAERVYKKLYASYKSFADIKQLEDGADTVALKNYDQALKTATEAPDIFEAYFSLGKLYFNVRKDAELGLKYAIAAQEYFPSYQAVNDFIDEIRSSQSPSEPLGEGVKDGKKAKSKKGNGKKTEGGEEEEKEAKEIEDPEKDKEGNSE